MTTKIEIVTVGALKQFLKDVPDNYEVILSKDGEGNVFSPLSSGISFGHFRDENALTSPPSSLTAADVPLRSVLVHFHDRGLEPQRDLKTRKIITCYRVRTLCPGWTSHLSWFSYHVFALVPFRIHPMRRKLGGNGVHFILQFFLNTVQLFG
jgi:hypothetical protein